jgi:micrococcal nuclease
MYDYRAEVVRIIDGDTVKFRLDLGFRLTFTTNFRMKGYDSPETYRPKSDEELERGQAATAELTRLLGLGPITVHSKKHGKYRWLGTVYVDTDDGVLNVNEEMVRLGHIK